MGAAAIPRDALTAGVGGTRDDHTDVRRAAAGDQAAFERLYRAHVARVHSLSRRMLSDEEADEATQDVFVRAWQKLGTFRGEAAFGTWLHRLAINVLLARRAKTRRDRSREQDMGGDVDGIVGGVATPELGLDFESAIGRLPKGAREVFVLHDVEGFKHQEIADMLGVTSGTTKAQLHRARMALRRYLDR